MSLDRTGWELYLRNVHDKLPINYEKHAIADNLADKQGSFIFQSFMNNETVQDCTNKLLNKCPII